MLYIMRHGKTDWNNRYKIQGRNDIPLNDEGRKMAEEAAEKYRDIHLDLCYSSPLMRAKETAEIFLRGRDIPLILDDRLVEMCFGIFEGYEHCYQKPDLPINILFKEPEKYKNQVEGAETFDELFSRTGEFLDEMIYPKLEEGMDILIVGHGAMNSSIICQVNNLPISQFWDNGIENCKLMQIGR